ncbi:LysR substrate-binding domain-containing protein [Paraburkholderia madseniana]|uniref:LysR substrate-binding domain-containing protein n=1 Tax=Paraburkholderia madseniana TaxID=2599607 RepID=A0AAP5BIY0_9BURK|nr:MULTISPECIES: LysR substrate-binding domain-containing protein [Paraburkholderia]MCX4149005.1 LysR substrate-binding domain-containing protein [Paraburkholderia madseniana]MDN7151942.1 LysR substrate-binding domain-containing protein [Paraburkholderia sp. WS6]MDQ6410822.1 LysR substrate-binding domain-containing protein [Paraburkholderia madseniana]
MQEPDLSDLKAFVAVTRARGFRHAALTGGVSASSLSEAVRRLEQQLGVRLLNRTTRSVTPTEAGQRLFERLAPAFGEITIALDAVNLFRESPTGTLRLNVPSIAAREILPTLLSRFLAAHPGITVDVGTNDTFIDILAAGFDAGIRYDERLERDMIAVPIGPRVQHFVAAAAPSYLAARGIPQHPGELLNHACIGHRFDSGVLATWEFKRGDDVVRIEPNGPMIASVIELERGAAIAGLGIVYSFDEFLRPAIEQGALVPVLGEWCQTFTGPFLYYPSRTHMPAPLRAFVDFILAAEESGSHP